MIKLQADLSTATAKTEQISWRPTMAVVPVVWWEKKSIRCCGQHPRKFVIAGRLYTL